MTKKCSKCGVKFNQKQTGRLRIAKKESRGEKIVWLCPSCSKELLKPKGD